MKHLIKATIITALLASCGQQSSSLNSVNPVLSSEQSVTDIAISCEVIENQRLLSIDAKASFVDSRDSLHLLTVEDGIEAEVEFALNERSGILWQEKSLKDDSAELELSVVAKGSNPGVIKTITLDLAQVCGSEENNFQSSFANELDALAADINKSTEVHKPSDDFCKLGIRIGSACLEGQLPRSLKDK